MQKKMKYGREGSVYGFLEGKKKIKKETRHEELKDYGKPCRLIIG